MLKITNNNLETQLSDRSRMNDYNLDQRTAVTVKELKAELQESTLRLELQITNLTAQLLAVSERKERYEKVLKDLEEMRGWNQYARIVNIVMLPMEPKCVGQNLMYHQMEYITIAIIQIYHQTQIHGMSGMVDHAMYGNHYWKSVRCGQNRDLFRTNRSMRR